MGMQRFLSAAAIGLAFTLTAGAQGYGGRPGDYGRGWGGYGEDVIGRTMADLSRVSADDQRDWKRVDHAQRELSKFRGKRARGEFDTHALDETIDELKRLTYSGRLNPRDREILARDIEPLREFRARRGYFNKYPGGWYDRGYYPSDRRW
jgi:hypothetical protein